MPPLPDVLANDPRIKGDMVRNIRDYALAAVEAYRRSRKPVAWTPKTEKTTAPYLVSEPPQVAKDWKWIPVYRLDDQP
jgi:hypothetical protein